MFRDKNGKVAKTYRCDKCDYSTCKKYNWTKHILTPKHKNIDNVNEVAQNVNEVAPKTLSCQCGKVFSHRQSLHAHKKICSKTELLSCNSFDNQKLALVENDQKKGNEKGCVCECGRTYKHSSSLARHQNTCPTLHPTTEVGQLTNLVKTLVEEIKKKDGQLMELAGKAQTVNNNTQNTTQNNFNLQLFLNEDCANALDIGQFIENVKVQLEDLTRTVEHGKKEGVLQILGRELGSLAIQERPIHCTDAKRNVMYIKEEGSWSKEESGGKLGKLIDGVSNKQVAAIKEWEAANPDFMDDSRKQDKWLSMVKNTTDTLDETAKKKIQKGVSDITRLPKAD